MMRGGPRSAITEGAGSLLAQGEPYCSDFAVGYGGEGSEDWSLFRRNQPGDITVLALESTERRGAVTRSDLQAPRRLPDIESHGESSSSGRLPSSPHCPERRLRHRRARR